MLSLCPLTVLPCSPLEQIDAAHEAGYDAVGLRLVPVLPTDIDVMADRELRRAIQKRLSATGLGVLDVEVARISHETDVQSFVPILQYAADVGARAFAVTGVPKAEWKPEHEPGLVAKLAELCEVAAPYNVRPTVEFMAFRSIGSLDHALRLRALAGHPSLGICVDSLHFQRSGGKPADLATIDPAALGCFQICDAPAQAPEDMAREARYGRLLPGKGGIPLVDIVAALPAGVPIGVEVPDTSRAHLPVLERAREALAATQAVLKAAGRG